MDLADRFAAPQVTGLVSVNRLSSPITISPSLRGLTPSRKPVTENKNVSGIMIS